MQMEQFTTLKSIFGEGPFTVCGVDLPLWNGLNVQAPMMILGETSQLGVLTDDVDKPKLSFALGDKPFAGIDGSIHSISSRRSHSLVASTAMTPYAGSTVHPRAERVLRPHNAISSTTNSVSSRGGFGLVIDAADSDASSMHCPC